MHDILSRPIPIEPRITAGSVVFEPPSEPFPIGMPLTVPGFGRPFVYADNCGEGHTCRGPYAPIPEPAPIFLDYEFAADRLATVRRLQGECREEGLSAAPAADARADEAERLLKAAKALAGDPAAASRPAMESLRESLWAGEMVVVERARQRIARRGTRPGFLFGCNAFGFLDYGEPYAERFEALFDYATLPFYHSGVEKVRGQRDYSRVESLLSWLGTTRILPKGHPLIFTHRRRDAAVAAEPAARRDPAGVPGLRLRHRLPVPRPHPRLGRRERAPRAARGRDRLHRLHVRGERGADPSGAGDGAEGRSHVLPHRQLHGDLGRLLPRAQAEFPSSSEDVPDAEWWGGGKGGARMAWHGETFSEETQADWLEQVYTIGFSKPYVVALTWWDLSDPAFMPHGGLVRKDMTPKKSYERLAALRRPWHGGEPPSAAGKPSRG